MSFSCCWPACTCGSSRVAAGLAGYRPAALPDPCAHSPSRCSAPTTACPCLRNTRKCRTRWGCCSTPRSRMVCSAFCVAPDIVATAGHCLFRVAGRASAAHCGFLVCPQLRHGTGLCARGRSCRRRHGPARDLGRLDLEHASSHRRHQGLGFCAAGPARMRQGRAAGQTSVNRAGPGSRGRQARVPDILSSRFHALEARLRGALRDRAQFRRRGVEGHRGGFCRP